MQTKALTEASMLSAVFIAMALMAYYIPLMSLVLFLFMGVPHALLTRRHGLRSGLLSLAVCTLVLFMLVDIIFASLSCVLFAICGIVLGICSARFSAGRSILIAALVTAVAFAVALVGIGQLLGIDIWNDMIVSYQASVEVMGGSSQLDPEELQMLSEEIGRLGAVLKPALLLAFGFMSAYLNYRMFQQIGRRFKIEVEPMPLLFSWRFPTWVGIAYSIGYMMARFIPDTSILNMVGQNIRMITYFPVMLQGLSLVVLFFGRYIRSKLFYVLLTIMVFTNFLLQSIVALIGLFDMFFDYRGWIQEKGVLQ